jgi:hypothetical protein
LPHSARLLSPLLLGAVIAGRPRRDRYGLTVIPLQVRGADPARRRDVLPLIVRELQPPTPEAVIMNDAQGRGGAAIFGQRLLGGMADRVVVTHSAIPEGDNAIIPVAALEPRWWDEGPLRLGGRLPPTLLALVQLAASDWTGLRSLARTALWEAYRERPGDEAAAEQGGWALLDGPTLLAAYLLVPPDVSSAAPTPLDDPHSSTLVRRALDEAARDARVAWSAVSHPDLTELSVVRASLSLPDAILQGPAVR